MSESFLASRCMYQFLLFFHLTRLSGWTSCGRMLVLGHTRGQGGNLDDRSYWAVLAISESDVNGFIRQQLVSRQMGLRQTSMTRMMPLDGSNAQADQGSLADEAPKKQANA
jgi:hypothetical protein